MGTTAIHKDSSVFSSWAVSCQVVRGPMDISQPQLGLATAGLDAMAVGKVGLNGTVSLGDGGIATLEFWPLITNGPGPDFAVFENAFSDSFLELAFVEVSSDGQRFVRFPAISLTPYSQQVQSFDLLDATQLYNLAGKYRVHYGVPFDLEELKDSLGLDITAISHVRVVDVIGAINPLYANYDSQGNIVNDPWPTPFPSSGFDLDGIGVLNSQELSNEILPHFSGSLNISPNPAHLNSIFELRSDGAIQGVLEIVTVKGEVVFNLPISTTNRTYSVRLPLLPESGLYIARFIGQSGFVLKKFQYVH
jgi:hypothetical protein